MTSYRQAFAPWETGSPALIVLCDDLPPEAAHGLAILWETAGLACGAEVRRPDEALPLPPGTVLLRYLPEDRLHRLPRPSWACLDIPRRPGDAAWQAGTVTLPDGTTVTVPAATLAAETPPEALSFDLLQAVHQLSTARWEIDAARRRVDSWSARTAPPPLEVPAVDLLALWFRDRLAEAFARANRVLVTVDRTPPGHAMTFLVTLDCDTYNKDLLERAKQVHGIRRRILNQLRKPRRDWRAALRTAWREGTNLFEPGPYDRIPKVAAWLEERGLRGSFNIYVPYRSQAPKGWLWRLRQKIYDPNYNILKMPEALGCLGDLIASGHEIGVQYGAFSSEGHPDDIALQADILGRAVGQRPQTGRHHFLKLNLATLTDLLERAALRLDTSPAYLDVSGFRLSAAGPVRGYNHMDRRASPLLFVPTPLWDGVLTNGDAEGPDAIAAIIDRFVACTARLGGVIAAGIHPRSFGTTDFYGPHWPTFELTLDAARRAGAWCPTARTFCDWWDERAAIRVGQDGDGLTLPPVSSPMALTLRRGTATWRIALFPDRPAAIEGPPGLVLEPAGGGFRAWLPQEDA